MQLWCCPSEYKAQLELGNRGERSPSHRSRQCGERSLVLRLIRGAALGAITTDFQPGDYNMEAAVSLNLPLQAIKEIAFEFRNLAAAQARHVDVVPLWAAFVEVLLALHVHQVEFVHKSVPLQEAQSAIHGYPVNSGVHLSRVAKDLRGIKVLLRIFDNFEDGAALPGQAKAA
jgi:hypothetical protein